MIMSHIISYPGERIQLPPAEVPAGQDLVAEPIPADAGILASVKKRFSRDAQAEQAIDEQTPDEQLPRSTGTLFRERIISYEPASKEVSPLLAVSPTETSGGSVGSVVLRSRIIEPPADQFKLVAEPVVTPTVSPKFTVVTTSEAVSATSIPEIAPSQVQTTVRKPKASARKRARKAPTTAPTTVVASPAPVVVPAEVPVVESKPESALKPALKISMIGGLAMATMIGGKVALKKTGFKKFARSSNPTVKTNKVSLRDQPIHMLSAIKTRLQGFNAAELTKKASERHRILGIAAGAVIVAGLGYAAHKGLFDGLYNPTEQADQASIPTAPPTFENAGVNPQGGGVSTTPIGAEQPVAPAAPAAPVEAAVVAPPAESAPFTEAVRERASEITVGSGGGFTEAIMDTGQQYGANLGGEQAYRLYEQLHDQFGSNLISGDTYTMANGDLGISSPGSFTWSPDVQHAIEEHLKEIAKKKKS